ncbi:adenylate cyclase, class 2 [Caloranaerobacter azorensis DSM 13643]|uniref:Adenylate cyclase, class 2 n=1 Tax=Caloranaerobacter azorensis DSM 13643 TaxID=1121264 RepID=A0A1M5R8P6_9FIRM|nr:class IV adenylate cyclase [Caloranaerobacter azorensis]SHH22203.1 adenylate cyclase, class 2 [Caloranaerobacter azorensis DSM 13643]
MAKELEVKVLDIDKDEIEKRLKEVGAKLISREYQINTIFDTEDRAIKNKQNGYLRIREKRDLDKGSVSYIFTLKKNISRDGVRENLEIETKIENKEALIRILESLNLKIVHEGTKERIKYKYEDITFDIDTWDNETYPYTYLEIEVKQKDDLQRAIRLLNLDESKVTLKSLAQLRMELGLGDL